MGELGKTFPLSNGTVSYAIKRHVFPGWADAVGPVSIRAMSLRGVEFAGLLEPLPPGTRMRLEFKANQVPRFTVEGRILSCQQMADAGGGQATDEQWPRVTLDGSALPPPLPTWNCTVAFTSYDASTWAHLRAVESWHKKAKKPRAEAPAAFWAKKADAMASPA